MGYIREAQARAKRRKSPWNFLLLLAVLFPLAGVWILTVLCAEALHTKTFPAQTLSNSRGIGPVLVAVAPFFGALPVGMMIGNLLVRAVPAARMALDKEAENVPGTDFRSAQKSLLKVGLVLIPISLLLTLFGVFRSWS